MRSPVKPGWHDDIPWCVTSCPSRALGEPIAECLAMRRTPWAMCIPMIQAQTKALREAGIEVEP